MNLDLEAGGCLTYDPALDERLAPAAGERRDLLPL
jgi:hypothetical protein